VTPRLLISVVVVLAAACSSGDDSTSADTTSATTEPTPRETTATTEPASTTEPPPTTGAASVSTTTSTTTSTTSGAGSSELTPDQLADQELARSALITIDSFPDGWSEEPESDDDSLADTEFEDQFDACLDRDDDVRVGDDLEELAVSTGDFVPGADEATSVSHEVVLAPDADTAITAMSEVSVDGAEDCIADVVQRFYDKTFSEDPALEGIAIGPVTVTRTEREQPPDIATGVLVEIPLGLETDTVNQYLEVLYQRDGRALSELSFTSLGTPFSRDGYTVLSDEAALGIATIGN